MKLLACALLVASALAAEPRCAIRGTVVDALTNRPLARAQVFAELDSDSDDDSTPPVKQISGDNGAFCFETLSSGSYKVRASHAAYLDAKYGQHRLGGEGANLEVIDGKPAAAITLAMTREATISGVLADADGDPVQGARIELLRRSWRARRLTAEAIQDTLTDDLGRYRLGRVAAGTYFISAAPAASVRDEMLPIERSFLDQDRHVFLQVEGKTYYKDAIAFTDAAPIKVTAGQDVSPLMLSLRTTEARHISGQVPPLALNTLPRILFCQEKGSSFGLVVSIPIEDNGHFLVEGLAPSRYAIWGPSTAGKEVDLIGGDVDNLVLEPIQQMTVEVRLHIEGRTWQPDIRTLALVRKTDDAQVHAATSAQFVSENKFKASVRPGQYEMNLGDQGAGYFIKRLAVDGATQLGSAFNLTGGGSKSVEVFLNANVASVEGSISGDHLSANRSVLVVQDESDPDGTQIKPIGNDGRFKLNLSHAGKYRLFAIQDFDSDAWENADLAALLADKSVVVDVSEGQHQHVSLPLITADEFAAAISKTN